MDDNFVWCALIFALAYVGRNMLPSYYELTKAKHSRIDAINDAVDDNEQTMLAMGKRLEELQSDVAGHLTRLDDLDETVTHNCLRLAVLEDAALSARTGKPANEARHD
jgi:hypothetical protein